ncbi:amino acid ABC transporter permease [Ureibacillus sp. FSL K6-8385]|uniref:Amino acid ABC transporter permease n=1 Tax=Ureibacillus terrenus TaxID=118246 RepID=A0A540V168_9BACL|nr:amino acid ABC transporter permease [Ureibacillus terrenus]MED3662311.1 amino acid ABC transporter permease [Ureibacillus terrenus]MED3764551.1 amino acid ABC transporter permease [Ureibacillus terrenus]TQE90494.1 amino acid ABC transporter permease [Ureibacillus terrenus]
MSFLETVWKIFEENWDLFLHGAWIALILAVLGTIFGALIGFFIGIMHTIPLSKKSFKTYLLKLFNFILTCYVELFRGTPMMVQAMVVFYGLYAIEIELNRFIAGLIVISLNTGAYMAEYVRGGIVSIDKGQFEASEAIGMSHFQTMLYIILPQVARNILPATGNQLVMNIKDSSVLSVISVVELFFATNSIAGSTYRYPEAFLIACVLYFIMTFTVTRILLLFEKKMDGSESYRIELVTGNKPAKGGE